MAEKYALKVLNFRTLTCFFLFLFFLLAVGSTGFAQEEKLKGKTVNINTGTLEQLEQVPLMTKEMAEGIIKYREDNGDFQVLEELLQVPGFNRELLRKLKPFLLLEGLGGEECTC